ncbi:IS3 family transposase [Yersinia intermedia]|uniref:IS3 family transposase n=1 Tax=Yersinia intermedia TaxID=631 RepID=UPI00164373E6|nr:IS3 family transposase [Yersinia intermedia]MCW8113876.1 IS3 family transposase [Yersinia intermedia]MDA5518675.1 IS3 family transposase [Yersinia intermedia]
MKSQSAKRHPPELRERAVKMLLEHRDEYDSEPDAIRAISSKIGCHYDTLRAWLHQYKNDARGGVSPVNTDDGGLSTNERQRLKELERENRELRRSNDILRQASAYFCSSGARPPLEKIMPLIQRLSGTHGVGPVCRELDIAPSTYYWHQRHQRNPEKCSQREKCDAQISQEIKRAYEENYSVYGARKVWRQLLREDFSVARCTVERLMKTIGLRRGLHGKVIRTTISRKTAAVDLVNRQFVVERPNQLWCADFTYVSTLQGFAYVAFIIGVFAGTIIGWRVSSSMDARFVLDALEQALRACRPSGTIHHSDKGSQYVSLAYTQRLQEAELLASTSITGDFYDNALAESINGLYKAEVIHRKSWKNHAEVELATLAWVDGFNNRRLLERLGHIPPVKAEKAYYASIGNKDLAA